MRISHWIDAIDTHTEGEPTRIITGGVGHVPGKNMVEKYLFVKSNLDHIRTALMLEPRGHRDMFGCLLVPPTVEQADYGVIFMDNEGYMNMCGHATIGLCTALTELGMVKTQEPFTKITLESTGGIIEVSVRFNQGRAESVCLKNVPAFVEYLDADLEISGVGKVKVDVAYGGNYFVFFSAEEVHLEIVPGNIERIIDMGILIREAANKQLPVQHPELKHVNHIYVATIVGKPKNPKASYRNIHLFSTRQFGRSPGGTGTSARMAVMHARGELRLSEEMWAESITGGLFKGRLLAKTEVGGKEAYSPEITGSARIIGFHQFTLDQDDPLKNGFLIH
jgi:proline racemase